MVVEVGRFPVDVLSSQSVSSQLRTRSRTKDTSIKACGAPPSSVDTRCCGISHQMWHTASSDFLPANSHTAIRIPVRADDPHGVFAAASVYIEEFLERVDISRM